MSRSRTPSSRPNERSVSESGSPAKQEAHSIAFGTAQKCAGRPPDFSATSSSRHGGQTARQRPGRHVPPTARELRLAATPDTGNSSPWGSFPAAVFHPGVPPAFELSFQRRPRNTTYNSCFLQPGDDPALQQLLPVKLADNRFARPAHREPRADRDRSRPPARHESDVRHRI